MAFNKFLCFPMRFAILVEVFGGVPGVDLDMPDSNLTSLDLRNHQKHPKQKKNIPKIKSKLFFSGPLFAYRVPLKGLEIGFQKFPAGYMEGFACRIRIRSPKSPNPSTRTEKSKKNHSQTLYQNFFFLVPYLPIEAL